MFLEKFYQDSDAKAHIPSALGLNLLNMQVWYNKFSIITKCVVVLALRLILQFHRPNTEGFGFHFIKERVIHNA